MDVNLAVVAGAVSTTIFALSTLPMLRKALKTKDLSSYSLGNIALSNAGNVIHAIYVFALPPGPIWILHSFYLVTTALMLIWYLRYEWQPSRSANPGRQKVQDAHGSNGRNPKPASAIYHEQIPQWEHDAA
jgi:uncharacterized protein with PQ loop repeat